MTPKEKRCLIIVTLSGLLSIGLSVLHLLIDFYIPGLNPIMNAIFWFFLCGLLKIRKQMPGGIWTFMYLLIVGLNLAAGVSQIFNAIT